MENKDFDYLKEKAVKEGIVKFVVGAVILGNNKILILKRKADDFMPSLFELPSGKVEDEERLIDALYREVKEETSLEVAGISRYLECFDYISHSGKKTRQFNFLVEVKNKSNVVLSEHDSYKWIDCDNISKSGVSDDVKKILSKLLHASY